MAKQKSQHNRERTVAIPNRIMNKVALSMIPMHKVDRQGFYGYEGSATVSDGIITIRGVCNISAQDMRMFNFVLSQWGAMRLTSKDDVLFVDLKGIIEALGWKNRTENRRKIITHLESMTNTTITFEYAGGRITFSTLDFVNIESYDTVSIRVSKTFEDTIKIAKQRFINIDRTMKLRSGYAMELATLLQLDGSGVLNGTGIPSPVNSISHSRICDYLLLRHGTKAATTEIRRAFKSLEAQGYPKYKNKDIRGQTIWIQEGKNLSKKSMQQ